MTVSVYNSMPSVLRTLRWIFDAAGFGVRLGTNWTRLSGLEQQIHK